MPTLSPKDVRKSVEGTESKEETDGKYLEKLVKVSLSFFRRPIALLECTGIETHLMTTSPIVACTKCSSHEYLQLMSTLVPCVNAG